MDKFYSSIKNFQQNDVFMCMYPGKKLPGFFARLSREESSLTNMTACRHYLQGEDSASNANEKAVGFRVCLVEFKHNHTPGKKQTACWT